MDNFISNIDPNCQTRNNCSILVFVPSLGAFLAPDLLGGAKTFMIGSLIEDQFKGNAGNWPFGAAASMILLSMVMIVLIYYARAQSKVQI